MDTLGSRGHPPSQIHFFRGRKSFSRRPPPKKKTQTPRASGRIGLACGTSACKAGLTAGLVVPRPKASKGSLGAPKLWDPLLWGAGNLLVFPGVCLGVLFLGGVFGGCPLNCHFWVVPNSRQVGTLLWGFAGCFGAVMSFYLTLADLKDAPRHAFACLSDSLGLVAQEPMKTSGVSGWLLCRASIGHVPHPTSSSLSKCFIRHPLIPFQPWIPAMEQAGANSRGEINRRVFQGSS